MHLKNSNRQVADSERIVAEWSNLIDTMRAERRDVTEACNLLKTFQDNLEVHRSNRDLFRQRVADAADEAAMAPCRAGQSGPSRSQGSRIGVGGAAGSTTG